MIELGLHVHGEVQPPLQSLRVPEPLHGAMLGELDVIAVEGGVNALGDLLGGRLVGGDLGGAADKGHRGGRFLRHVRRGVLFLRRGWRRHVLGGLERRWLRWRRRGAHVGHKVHQTALNE